MKKCPRSGDESVEAVHSIDESLSYGPREVLVACEFFKGDAQLSIKGSMIVIDTGIDSAQHAASIRPATATYVIYLDDIVDVQAFSSNTSVEGELEHGLHLLLSNNQSCAVESIYDEMVMKAIICAWQTQLLRRSARVPKPRSAGSQLAVAQAYYQHVVHGLQHCAGVDELMDLLQEFSREVLTNQSLKVMAFDRKELLGALVSLWNTLLIKRPLLPSAMEDSKWKALTPQEMFRKAVLYNQLKSSFDDEINLTLLQNDYTQHLLTVVAQRMRILALITQTLSALFFGSDLVPTRTAAVTDDNIDSPLGISVWMRLLSMDTLTVLCEVLGVPDDAVASLLQSVAANIAPEPSSSKRRASAWASPIKVVPAMSALPRSDTQSFGVDNEAIADISQCKPLPSPSS